MSELSNQELVSILQSRGYDVSPHTLNERRITELREQLVYAHRAVDEAVKRVDSIVKEIQSLCDHVWGQSRYSDSHDGYSRVTLTETETKSCVNCGFVHVREFQVSH
ncbi:hypothetical protein My1_053 [Pectobacterium phage My1]|uniref:Uncharacterized protein n=1 Tax=Pectobacterium phage My1 TaxID=1204539 RepID=J9QNV9_9CAUD|nr:hypothetical protein My1_053 [Pectobacterium phage My1]AFQ22212.1 hypothetical protein My1_053 [Pectobacterium phage My1]